MVWQASERIIVSRASGQRQSTRLTPKKEKALSHYLKHRDVNAAYRSAYDCSGMTDRTIASRAYDLFADPVLKAIIESVQHATVAEVKEEIKIDAKWVLERASRLADFNINRFIQIDDSGQAVYNFNDATDLDWYCISEYTYDRILKGPKDATYPVEKVKLKANCKLKALELVGKHIDVAAFEERISVQGELATLDMNLEEYKQARREMIAEDDC